MMLSNAAVNKRENWQAVCRAQDLVADSGVVVWLDGAQVRCSIYLAKQALYAVDNRDPRSGPTSSAAAWWVACRVSWWWRRLCAAFQPAHRGMPGGRRRACGVAGAVEGRRGGTGCGLILVHCQCRPFRPGLPAPQAQRSPQALR